MIPAIKGTYEWLVVVGIVVLLFGARKLPELGKSLGEGIKEFRKSSRTIVEDDEKKETASNEEQKT